LSARAAPDSPLGPWRPARLRAVALVAALACLGGAGLLGVLAGPAHLDSISVVLELLDRAPLVTVSSSLSEREAAILWQLRVPRVIVGGLVGSTLAVAGTAYQGVFRNPLSDPYLLGVAAGAGLGATLAVAYLPRGGGWPVDPLPPAAFAGALIAVASTYALAASGRHARTITTLILAGVAVAAFFTAAQTFVQQRDVEDLREVYAWLLGTLGTVGWREVALLAPYAAGSSGVIWLHRRLLDVMSVGDEEAGSLGVDTKRVRLIVVVAASLATAAAVAVSGLIGFVGIIVPHALRLLVGPSYRVLVPLALVLGAAFLVLADLLARTLMAPAELPIGVITAFVGAPFFLVVLRTTKRLA
jgi:iron complex transport system permease protein